MTAAFKIRISFSCSITQLSMLNTTSNIRWCEVVVQVFQQVLVNYNMWLYNALFSFHNRAWKTFSSDNGKRPDICSIKGAFSRPYYLIALISTKESEAFTLEVESQAMDQVSEEAPR